MKRAGIASSFLSHREGDISVRTVILSLSLFLYRSSKMKSPCHSYSTSSMLPTFYNSRNLTLDERLFNDRERDALRTRCDEEREITGHPRNVSWCLDLSASSSIANVLQIERVRCSIGHELSNRRQLRGR